MFLNMPLDTQDADNAITHMHTNTHKTYVQWCKQIQALKFNSSLTFVSNVERERESRKKARNRQKSENMCVRVCVRQLCLKMFIKNIYHSLKHNTVTLDFTAGQSLNRDWSRQAR